MNEWMIAYICLVVSRQGLIKLLQNYTVIQRRYKNPHTEAKYKFYILENEIKCYLDTQPGLMTQLLLVWEKTGVFTWKHLPHPGEKTTNWVIGHSI